MIASSMDFVALTHAWLAALFRASWQGAIAVGLVWCLCRWVTSMPASVRCWLWRLVLVKFLLLAVWPGTIDLRWLPVNGLWGQRERQEIRQPLATDDNRSFAGAAPTRGENNFTADSAPQAAAGAAGITVGSILWAVWVLGVAIVAAVLFVRARAARRWRKRCTLVKDADILTVCEGLADELGVYQPPVLFVSDACESPVVFGALRTSVVLPASLVDRRDPKRLRLILRHELAHIRRGDLVWNWVATAVWGLFFFHPLVWVALRELRLNQELACDAYAIRSRDTSPADYGTLLVELADQTRAPSNMLVTVGVVESFEFLKRRLKAMKDSGDRSPWGTPVSVSLLSLAVVGLLPWRLVAQAPKPDSDRFSTSPEVDVSDATDKTSRPVLAATFVDEFRVAIDGVRWVEMTGYQWVETGLPYEVISGESGGFGGVSDAAVLVVDLHVSRPSDDTTQLLCAVVGRVQAQDDRGNSLDTPDLPAHLRMELQGVEYPRGSGRTAIHLASGDKNARSIRSLAGELLVTDVKVETIAFQGDELSKVTNRQLSGGTVQLEEVQSTEDGIGVSVSFSMRGGGDPIEAMRKYGAMHNWLRVVLEDSEGNTHEPQMFSTGGGGGDSFSSSSNSEGGKQEVRTGSYAMSQSLLFPPLPRGVTVKRIVCSMTDLPGEPRRIAFEFADLPLP